MAAPTPVPVPSGRGPIHGLDGSSRVQVPSRVPRLSRSEQPRGMRVQGVAFMALGVAMAYIGLQPKRMWTKIWQRSLLVILGIPIVNYVFRHAIRDSKDRPLET